MKAINIVSEFNGLGELSKNEKILVNKIKQYARIKCQEQREICVNEFNETEFPTYSLSGKTVRIVNDVIRNAPEPELK